MDHPMDLSAQPEIIQQIAGYAFQGWDIAKGWLLSPAAWSQLILLIVAYVMALYLTKKLRPLLTRLLTPKAEQENIFASARRFVLIFLPLLLPLIAYALTGVGEQVTSSIFGSSAVIAFGKRVFLFLAARLLVQHIITDGFLKLLGKFVLVPVAALYAVGVLDVATARLETLIVPLGNLSFSVLFAIRFAVVGGIIFWIGRWSNDQSSTFIAKQDEMRPATQQLASKTAEIAIFGAAFLVLMNIMGISLSSLAVLGGAIGVGLGFGLQKIASNFISGVILLLEGQATVGD
jgi:potassium efflux system protein